MAIGFKHGAGGGGYELNFRVINSNTQPTDPKENTIWISTSNTCYNWRYCKELPFRKSRNKNFCTYPPLSESGTISGITFSVNTASGATVRGKVTASGTATANIYFWHSKDTVENGLLFLKAGKYFLSGCPAGGGSGKYSMQLAVLKPDNLTSSSKTYYDYGNGKEFELTEDSICRVGFYIAKGTKFENVTFYFQVEEGDTATDYEYGNANGQVWLKPGQSPVFSVEAFKKSTRGDNIVMDVSEVWLYRNGYDWTNFTDDRTKVFQGGEWKSLKAAWDGYYFKDGEQYTDVTGGWTKDGWGGTGPVTIGSTIAVGGSSSSEAVAGTANAVDLSSVSKVWIDSPNGTGGYGIAGYMFIAKSKSIATSESVAYVQIKNAGSFSIDVSSLSGKYYIYLYAGGGAYVDARAIWME